MSEVQVGIEAMQHIAPLEMAVARAATEQVIHHCADALETLSALDGGTST